MKTVNTKHFGKANIVKRLYADNKRTAVMLIDAVDGSPITTLSVNIPEAILKEGEFCVKGWSENMQIVEDCRNSGHFIDTGKRIPVGYVQAEIWKFKEENFI